MLNSSLMVFLTTLTFILIWRKDPCAWQLSYAVLFLVGLITSAVTYMAILPMLILVLLLVHYRSNRRFSLVAGLFALVIGLALGLHTVPGFNNYQYANELTLSTSVASFDLWFNWDKSMFGLLVLGIVLHGSLLRNRLGSIQTLNLFLPLALIGITVIYAIGLLTGYSDFDWTPSLIFFPWALKNIVFTVLAEEVFFRGIVQHQLGRHIKGKYSGHLAVLIAGILFGIAHFSGGVHYVFLSSLAGILYGYTYLVTGRIEAPIITHFLLNAGHFLILAYPYSLI